jgi:hypothetical protein
MIKLTKNLRVFALTLLMTAILAAAFAPNISVKAQSTADVTVFTVTGGTTDPTGTNTYNDGDIVNVTATADTADGYNFYYWLVSSPALSEAISTPLDKVSQFPPNTNFITTTQLSLLVTGGSTYSVQPVFLLPSTPNVQFNAGTNPLSHSSADAFVIIVPAVGGTTFPLPGTYEYSNTANVTLTAIAQSGWVFSHWTISGTQIHVSHGGVPYTLTPTDNPYTVSHGEGYTYAYQPVFVPTGTTEPTPTPTSPSGTGGMSSSTYTAIIIALAVILVIVLIGFAVYAMRRKK